MGDDWESDHGQVMGELGELAGSSEAGARQALELLGTVGPVMHAPPLLTDLELHVVDTLGTLWGDICSIVGDGPTREPDLAEMIHHVHALQHKVMAQAAARAYPDCFRLLGRTVGDP